MRRIAALAALALALLIGPGTAEALAGTIEGTVTPTKWAPEIEVCVFGTTTCAVPRTDGSYKLEGVSGTGLVIQFIPRYRSGLLTQYYSHKAKLSEATPLAVPASRPLTGIDGDLVEGGSIEGIVTAAPGGAPLAEVEVCAVSGGGSSHCTESNASGGYEIRALPKGAYFVEFWGAGKSAEYAPAPFTEPPSTSPASVQVHETETVSGISASLVKGAQVKGVVTAAATGAPQGGVNVCLFAADGSAAQRCAFTESDGGYVFQGLANGAYQVGFSLSPAEAGGGGQEDGFEAQYYDGVTNRAQAAILPVLAPQVLEGVDAALTSPSPPPVITPLPAAAPLVPAPPVISAPGPAAKGCHKPKRKQRVKGKVRCVKPAKKKKGHHHKKKPSRASHHRG
jgi:Carboxypeptidase regulatory-like domain